MQDQVLLTVTIVTDDETGIWKIGELDFGILGISFSSTVGRGGIT